MQAKQCLLAAAVAAASAALLPTTASAQTAGTRTSMLPGTTSGYVGANLARPDYGIDCTPAFSCSDPSYGGKVYVGGAWSEVLGLELGYINFGKAERAGGHARAQGVSLSALGNFPVTDAFNVFGRVGTTYARTRTSASPFALPSVATGNRNTFGVAFGVGVGYELNNNIDIVGEWERHRLKFVSGRDNIDMLSVGVRYRY